MDQTTIEQALNLDYPDFEDAVQMISAVQCKADYLITRNIKEYDPALLTVAQPIDVLATFLNFFTDCINKLLLTCREHMKEYLQIRKNGEVTLPPAICRAAKLQEGDLLEAAVEEDGIIRLIPKSGEVRKLMEQSQLKDINWASEQKREAKK